MPGIVNAALTRLLNEGAPFSSRQVSALTGASRQAVHKHLKLLVAAGRLSASGRARAARYTPVAVSPLRTKVEVASAGSRYRLSARLLLLDVPPGEVVVDFTGVDDLGDEFLEELFLVWAPAHPEVTLKVAHLPSKLARRFFEFARGTPGAVASAG
ncbi:MAG: DUF4325 domain-containing protein [Myxococcaceae bacterium]|nr:DUF4325 domain-containing protein [Myxococcaceae bacterium]